MAQIQKQGSPVIPLGPFAVDRNNINGEAVIRVSLGVEARW
jgi:hypothetical protein